MSNAAAPAATPPALARASIYAKTLTGAMDLLQPHAAQVDFHDDMAVALSRIPRFSGHTRPGKYTVAQHCVLGADYLFHWSQNEQIAAAFLLHDAHEAYIGDISTPTAKAIAAHVGKIAATQDNASLTAQMAIENLRASLDRAIYRAAGLTFPLDNTTAQLIRDTDREMLATEWAALISPHAPEDLTGVDRWPDPIPTMVIEPWTEDGAREQYRERLGRYLPAGWSRR